MTDNLRRAMQDIDLGSEDAPFVLPPDVVRQAAAENRFILIGRPSMPHRQNLRNLVATMPRVWGLEGLARGRVIEGRRFQFVFPSEEAMDTVVRRGPWAYADGMIVLQRWTPLMDMALLNFIPFWIQVRGIPLQYMNRTVIVNIARVLGEYIQMDYNEEVGSRMEFVRVRLNWNVNNPLKFQRNFQFTPGVNTLLRIQYERLRGFCETCGMITHDSGACLIQNGGADQNDEDNDSEGDDADVELVPNQGVLIEEINGENEAVADNEFEGHNMEAEAGSVDPEQEEYERNIRAWEEENDVYNPIYPHGQFIPKETPTGSILKRKAWLSAATDNSAMFHQGEASGTNGVKRKKGQGMMQNVMEADVGEAMVDTNNVRGAVGPKPPLPP